jgi:hypothetical protein
MSDPPDAVTPQEQKMYLGWTPNQYGIYTKPEASSSHGIHCADSALHAEFLKLAMNPVRALHLMLGHLIKMGATITFYTRFERRITPHYAWYSSRVTNLLS